MDESTLLELARKQNQQALSMLLSQNYEIVYGYLIKLTLNQELAKDLTQDTMVKAIVNLNQFKGKSKFSTWLITIGSNLYKNYLKKNKRIQYTDDFSFLDQTVESRSKVEHLAESKETTRMIFQALSQMKMQQRMPFLLKHYYGYSYEEISTILDCPLGTVRSRIHNTIKKLQKIMKGDHHEV